jgi:hypothetical protein
LVLARGSDEVDRISSQNLVDALVALEESPWATLKNGKPITKQDLAAKLRNFDVRPCDINFGKELRTLKGYKLENFLDAFERYLPKEAQSGQQGQPASKGVAPVALAPAINIAKGRNIADQGCGAKPGKSGVIAEIAGKTGTYDLPC